MYEEEQRTSEPTTQTQVARLEEQLRALRQELATRPPPSDRSDSSADAVRIN